MTEDFEFIPGKANRTQLKETNINRLSTKRIAAHPTPLEQNENQDRPFNDINQGRIFVKREHLLTINKHDSLNDIELSS